MRIEAFTRTVHEPWVVPAAAGASALLAVLAARAPGPTAAAALGLAATVLALRRFAVAVALFTVLTFVKGAPLLGGNAVTKLATAGLVLSWLLLLAGRRARPELLDDHPLLAAAAAALAAWAAASALWAFDDNAALSGAFRLAQMLLLLLLVCTAVASASDLRLLAWAFVAGAALTTLLPLAGVAAGTDEGGRFGGDLGNPNNLAAVVLPALALVGFMLVAARGRGERLLLAAAGAVLIVAFVRTESRGGLVGLGVMAVAAIALAGPARRRVLAALLLLCGAVALWFAAIAPGDARSRATDFSTAHSTGRVDLWHVAERMAANHPLQGIGIDNFAALEPTYLPSELDVGRADLVLRGTLVHNTYLNLLAELGVVGAALFAALVVGALAAALAAIRTLAQRGDRQTELLARGLATGAVGMLAAYVFFSAQYEKQLWIVLGALLALSSVARRRAALRPGGGARSDAVSS